TITRSATAIALLVQREDEQVARVLELVPVHRVEMPAAGLHREEFLRADRVDDRRALERRADVEAPELLERLVVVGHDPAVLQRGEDQAAGGRGRARADFD